MKPRTSPEDELNDAEDVYRHGPRVGIRFVHVKPFQHSAGSFSFSDRFVLIYFLVLIILVVLGVMAILNRSGNESAAAQATVMYLERSRA